MQPESQIRRFTPTSARGDPRLTAETRGRCESLSRLLRLALPIRVYVQLAPDQRHAEGFRTRLLIDLTVGVAAETTAAALEELAAAGVEIVTGEAPPGLVG